MMGCGRTDWDLRHGRHRSEETGWLSGYLDDRLQKQGVSCINTSESEEFGGGIQDLFISPLLM